MTPHELRGALQREAVARLFGPDWRADRPLEEIGGLVGQMVNAAWLHQSDPLARASKIAGEAQATLRVIALVDEAMRADAEPEKP